MAGLVSVLEPPYNCREDGQVMGEMPLVLWGSVAPEDCVRKGGAGT